MYLQELTEDAIEHFDWLDVLNQATDEMPSFMAILKGATWGPRKIQKSFFVISERYIVYDFISFQCPSESENTIHNGCVRSNVGTVSLSAFSSHIHSGAFGNEY